MSSGNDSDTTSPVEIGRHALDGAAGLRLPQALIDRQTEFWRSVLAGAPTLLELPSDYPRPQRQDFAGDMLEVRLDAALVARLRALGERHDATLQTTLLAAWAAVLGRLSNQDSVVIGSPVDGRGCTDIEPLIDLFDNTVALRIDLNDAPTVAGLLAHAKRRLLDAMAHQDLPFDLVVEAVNPSRSAAHAPLFQTMLAWRGLEQARPASQLSGAVQSTAMTGFDLTLELQEHADVVDGSLTYATSLFETATAERYLGYWLRVLQAMTDADAQMMAKLPIIGPDESTLILQTWNRTAREYPQDLLAHQLFEAQVERTPDAVAIAYEQQTVSFAELNRRANRLAHHLRGQGVSPDDRIAICMERSPDLVVAVLGVLKAGVAYLPMDTGAPQARLQYLLEDCAPKVLVTHSAMRERLPATSLPMLWMDTDAALLAAQPEDNLDAVTDGPTASHLAYVIYTSGSTGLPKGVMVEHRGLIHYLQWALEAYARGGAIDTVVSSPIAFDATITSFYLPLISGGCAKLLREGDELLGLEPLLKDSQSFDLIKITPAHLSALGQRIRSSGVQPAAKLFVVGGEALPASTVALWKALCPEARIVNEYGPTETVVGCVVHEAGAESSGNVPIGRPIANMTIRILDALLQPVPVGVVGEIFIGGASVARGYLNRPELTAERFLEDPFADATGARMYRTGDLARWLPDGKIEYLGRNDFQVKIRGFRIELGEIEAKLCACSCVREAVVLARSDDGGEKRLVAYYLADEQTDDMQQEMALLRQQLAQSLPDYMVPSAYVRMASWPLTGNGKIDRNALPVPEDDAYARGAYEPPRGEVEEYVAAVWAELLQLERVGRYDNFFELGGHSLFAVVMIERMRKLSLHVDVGTLFTAPTLKDFAANLQQDARDTAVPVCLVPDGAERIEPDMLTLVSLSQDEIDTIATHVDGGASNIQDIYPLSPLQEGILFHYCLEQREDLYLNIGILPFPDQARIAGFLAALRTVVERHDILRTSLFWENLAEPVQVVHRKAEFSHEALTLDPADGPIKSQLFAKCDPSLFRMDLTRAPLFRFFSAHDPDTGRWLLMIAFHHIAIDHMSLDLIMEEAAMIEKGRALELPKPAPFRNYIWQSKLQADPLANEAFFTGMLAEIDEPTAPFGLNGMNDDGSDFGEYRRMLPADVSAGLRQRARTLGVSVAAIMHLAWAMLLSRATGMDRVVFGTVLFGRMDSGQDADRALGLFINTLPIRVDLDHVGVADAIRRTHESLAELLRYEHASLADAQRCSSVPTSVPLFTSLFNYLYNVDAATSVSDILVEDIEDIEGGERTNYPLSISVTDSRDGFGFIIQVKREVGAERVFDFMRNAVSGIMDALDRDPALPVQEIDILPDDERSRLLCEWNDTGRAYPAHLCVHRVFEMQAEQTPDAVAISYGDHALTYAELNLRANRLAHRLIAVGVEPDDRVAICMERSPEMVIGFLAILKAGGAYVPVDPGYPQARLEYLLRDSGPVAIIAGAEHASADWLVSAALPVLTVQSAIEDRHADSDDRSPDVAGLTSRSLAYVIYTSGSTGEPKGVMVEHRNIVRLTVNNHYAPVDAADCIAHCSNPAFDASTWEIWGALLNGARVLVLDPQVVLDPQALNRALIDGGATALWMTVGLFNEYLDTLAPAFSTLKHLLIGGDALDVRKVAQALNNPQRPKRLVNGYGPTETTTFAATHDIGSASVPDPGSVRSIPIGAPIANTRIYLLDPQGRPVPVGVSGEIHIGGDGVARGYLNRPALTEERFLRDPFSDAIDARMYRTGDLGRWLADGSIEFMGRNDFQVKIRGYRIELGEIETRFVACPGIREAVVLACSDTAGEKRLVGYYLADEAQDSASLRQQLSQSLPEYMVPSAFVRMASWPLTANGKLDRKALPAPDDDAFARTAYEAPRGALEEAVAAIWSSLLQVERVGRRDNFFELGGHSLLAVQMVSRLRKTLDIELSLRELFDAPSLSHLAEGLAKAGKSELTAIPVVERQSCMPLSLAQQRLWFLTQIDGASAAYHVSTALRLSGDLDRPALERSLQSIIDRHEALRVGFVLVDGQPMQSIATAATLALEFQDLRRQDERERIARDIRATFLHRPFDLRVDLPLRVQLLQLEDGIHELQILMHHIVSDGWSVDIMLDEIGRLYAADLRGESDPLPPLQIQYADYAQWQRRWLAEGQYARQSAFWQKALAGAPTLLELPADRPRPLHQDYAGDALDVHLDAALTSQLKAMSQRHGATLYMTLLASWAAVLGRLANQQEVVIGSPVAGRNRAEVEPLIGFFVNTLALRIDLGGEPGVAELLAQVRSLVLEAQAHQDLPFDQVVEAVKPPRNTGHAPIFQAMFAWHNLEPSRLSMPRLQTTELSPEATAAAVDLTLDIGERGDAVVGHLNYATSLFDRGTAERYLGYWLRLLHAMVDAQSQPVSRLPILGDDERTRVLHAWNDTARDYPLHLCVHQLFEQQAVQSPEAIAVVHGDERIAYAELNARANRMAHHLRQLGLMPEQRVAICSGRSVAMVTAVLAVLKAGAAYLPLDPAYPPERLGYQLADAQVALLLADDAGRAALADALRLEIAPPVLDLDDAAPIWSQCSSQDPDAVQVGLTAANTAYVIYTSGSTGLPKGTLLAHSGATNLACAERDLLVLDSNSRVLQFASFAFDACVWEMFATWCAGATLVLPAPGKRLFEGGLIPQLCDDAITHATLPPALLNTLPIEDLPDSLETIVLAGEAPEGALIEGLLARHRVVNAYGPTEATVCATMSDCRPGCNPRVIGGPLPNARIYVLDERREPVPVGVVGEIHIGGAGVARGYLNRPELTAERFLDDPFSTMGNARMYRTGDLGRWLPDGTIEFLGRNDFQVKIRGFRVELGEIEAKLLTHAGMREAVVLAREDSPGDKRLIAYFTADAVLDASALRESLSQSLPDYMVPAAFVRLDALPLTPNGKLDRKALPAPDAGAFASRAYAPPQGRAEEIVAAIWQELLRVERVGRHDNFFELGGHSLIAVTMIDRMRKQDLHADVRALFTASSLMGFAEGLRQDSREQAVPPTLIPQDAKRITPEMLPLVSLTQAEIDAVVARIEGGISNIQDIYPLSPLQEGILFHRLLEQNGDIYHASAILTFADRNRIDGFLSVLQKVVDRHDILRTSFIWDDIGEPVQVVQRKAAFAHEALSLDSADGTVRAQLAAQYDPSRFRMDLMRAPLFRCCYAYDQTADRWLMCVAFHHLVMDHTSLEVIMEEATLIEQGRESELPKPAPYRNYIWQAKVRVDRSAHKDFFTGMLADVDRPTTPFGLTAMNDDGSAFVESRRRLPLEMSAELRRRARELGVGTAAIMHLAWALVLARATDMDRVVFGTVLFGRMDGGEDADRALGLFINTLPIRIDLDDAGVADAIKRTHASLAGLLRYEHASLAVAQRYSGLPASMPLFTSLLNYRYSSNAHSFSDDIGMENIEGGERTNYPLTVAIDDLGADFEIGVQTMPSVGAERVCDFLQTALSAILVALESGGGTAVSSIDVIPGAEFDRIVHEWNETRRNFPLERCAHELFAMAADNTPEAAALVFGESRLAYAELNSRANRLAHYLQAQGVGPGALVAVSLERGIDMIVVLLGVLKAGGAYVPMAPDAPAERVAFMLADAAPKLLLAHAAAQLPANLDVPATVLETLWPRLAQQPDSDPRIPGLTSSHPAYVIYTSGTTGVPKGVVVSHRNLVNFCYWCQDAGLFSAGDRITQFAPYTFDASAGEIFAGLLAGTELHLLDDGTIQNPQQLQAYLVANAIRFSAFPPAYLQQMDPDLVADGFKLLTAGSAPTPELVERWAGRGRYLNGYGPTETTILSTAMALRADEEVITIGHPIANTRVYLLDAQRRPVPVAVPGEIWIGGEGVTQGYLNRPELTAETFLADPFSDARNARMYKTGDLGRRLPDGAIEFLGRNDFQVKIRGFRIELGEIEARLCEFDDVREAVVLARGDGPGEKQLVAYYLAGQTLDAATLRQQLAISLPDYMLPAAFVHMQAWPSTTNGKIDRKALPAPDDDAYARRAYEAPQGDTETALAAIWAELLRVENVGRRDSFFELGGHSLLAVQLVSRIRQMLGIELPLRAVFEASTLSQLAERIGDADVSQLSAIALVERQPCMALSLAQQRLWFLSRIEGASAAYHMGGALRLTGKLDQPAFERALQRVIDRHECLRTRFVSVDGQPMQVIAADATFAMTCHDLRECEHRDDASRALSTALFSKPFDLGVDLPLRVQLVHLEEGVWELHLVMHHIVSDGWSIGILIDELSRYYTADVRSEPDPLPPLPIQYVDYAHWQQQWLSHGQLAKQSAFWKKTLADAPTLLQLPTDRPRPAMQDFSGEGLSVRLDAVLTGQLKVLSQRHGATLYMTLLASWAAVLSRLSNQDDVVIGSPVAGRNRAEVEALIGFFVNTLAMRIDLSGEPTVGELLARTRHQVLEAQAHQDLPFDQVVEAVRPHRTTAHTPIFQTMLTLNNQDIGPLRMPGLQATEAAIDFMVAQFDIALDLAESEGEIVGVVSYATALFDRDTIARYARCWQLLLAAMVDADGQVVARLPILDDEARTLLLDIGNGAIRDDRRDLFLQQRFEAQSCLTPDAVAVFDEEESLSYEALNRRANRLAHRLIALGVGPDARVAICLQRGIEMIVCLLAVLKAGGAYVWADPDLPTDRIDHLLGDCAPKALLTRLEASATLPKTIDASVIVLHLDREDLSDAPSDNPDTRSCGLTPRNLAYVIYTSGSTGVPKGVLIEHASAAARIDDALEEYALTPEDRCIQFSSLSFDASVMQIFSALAGGASLLVRGRTLWSPDDVVEMIERHRITVADIPPSYLQTLLEPEAQRRMPDLRVVVVGGEASLTESVRGKSFAHAIINEYGPTEATITAIRHVIRAGMGESATTTYLPIGRPVADTRIHILDRYLQPVPVGVCGEIHIGGAGLARGYLNRPGQTAERFLEDPFRDEPGARIYRTGDLARWSADGNIEYLGRNDFQVKIRGFRIELGEIESRLREVPGVRETAVLAREDVSGQKRLVAYCLTTDVLDVASLKQHLAKYLPDYMVPAAFVSMREWPMTSSGKLDRNALPLPEEDAYARGLHAPPQGEIERTIAALWQVLLGLERVGRHDNFFDLGGHSILLLRMLRMLEEQGMRLAIQDVYTLGTVQAIAASVASSGSDPVAWLQHREWPHAVATVDGKKVLWLAPADASQLLLLKKLVARSAAVQRPDCIIVDQDPLAARDAAQESGFRLQSDTLPPLAGFKRSLADAERNICDAGVVDTCAFTAIQHAFLQWEYREDLHVVPICGWWSGDDMSNAFTALVRNQDMLRAVARIDIGQWQVLDPDAFLAGNVPVVDLRGLNHVDAEAAFESIGSELRRMKASSRLCYVAAIVSRSDTDHALVLFGDHLIWDGRSFDAMAAAMIDVMSGSAERLSGGYRGFAEDCAKVRDPAALDRLAMDLDVEALSAAMSGTTRALAARAALPPQVIAASLPLLPGVTAAEQAFDWFRRLALRITGLDRFCMVLTHHGRRIEQRTYFDGVGLFLDKVPSIVGDDTLFDAPLARVDMLQRHGIRYIDWQRSGDARVADTLPAVRDEISFNYQSTVGFDFDRNTVDFASIFKKMRGIYGIICEVYAGAESMDILFAYRGLHGEVEDVKSMIESASGALLDIGSDVAEQKSAKQESSERHVSQSPAQLSEQAIVVEDLRKRYSDVDVVKGISFSVPKGSCFGILGPNGAGKTSLLGMIEGILPISSGRISVLGMDVATQIRMIQPKVGVQLQQNNYFQFLSVEELLTFYMELRAATSGKKKLERPDKLLDRLDLGDKMKFKVDELSGGQKQRLSIAIALLGDPEIIFLDEPTSALDPHSRRYAWEFIEELKQDRRRTIVLTTHYMEEAERLCDEIMIMNQGEIVDRGNPASLIAALNANQQIRFKFDSEVPGEALAKDLSAYGAAAWDGFSDSLLLNTDDVATAVRETIALAESRGIRVFGLEVARLSLEDVFLNKTGKGLKS